MAAAPAQAAPASCMVYLHDKGYIVGPKAKQACHYGHEPSQTAFCAPALVMIGVRSQHAFAACDLARR